MKKRLLLIFLTIILLIPVSLLALMNSEWGTRWLLLTFLPAEASIQNIQGSLLDHLSLNKLRYKTPGETVEINQFNFVWQPVQLWSGTLKIVELAIDDVNISLTESTQPEEKSEPFDFNAPLALPIDLIIENLRLSNLQFQQGETQQSVAKLQLIAKTENGQLKIQTLVIDARPLAATLQGQIHLGKGFAFSLNTNWQINTEQQGNWRANSKISGDTKKIIFRNDISSPFAIGLKGIVKNPLDANPHINARLDWQNIKYPLTGDIPQVKSEKGVVRFIGLLSDYRLKLNAQLTQDYLPNTSLVLDSQGSLEAITIKKLELKSTTGTLQTSGIVGWKDKTTFDIKVLAQNFNPAIIMPDMAGNLSLDSHFKGQFTDKLQLDVAIHKLAGVVRGYPVSADGKLLLVGDQLTVNALNLNSGRNKIAANGTLGEKLNIDIDTPTLNTLWPTLGGSLKARASLQGEWQNPAIKMQASGQGLKFAEHGVEQLNINIDYDPATNKTSQLQFIASRIKTGATQIAKLLIEGQGSIAQHSVKAEVSSQYGDVATLITGGIKTENWQGALAKLSIDSKDAGLWQLNRAMNIHASKNKAGIDVAANEGCLVQRNAALCVQGVYSANGDLAGQLKIVDLPSALIQSQLPPDIKLITALNADATVQAKKGVLSGQYRVTTTPTSLIVQNKELHTGASSVSGKLNGTQVSADIDLALLGQDAVRGQIRLDTGKNQALSGQLYASVVEFAALKAFVPQLSDLKGQLKANIKLAGTMTKPVINGDIDLNNGMVAIAESDFAIHDITLHAQASGGDTNHIRLQGSLSPSLTAKKPDAMQLSTRVNVHADLQQQASNLTGQYQIDVPPTTISLANAKIPLGMSSLSGKLAANRLFADLKLALIKQDYLRAQLELATDDSKTLSGQITASVLEFAALNRLVPQVSGLKGQLKANLNLAGTTEKPTANGAVNFSSGEMNIVELGLQLRQINLQAQTLTATADRIQLKGSAKSGEGTLKLDGVVGLQAEAGFPVDLMITGDNFEVAKLPEAEVAVSPQLKVAFAKAQGKVTGKLAIPKAVIQMQQIPENAISVSKDEVIIGETEEQGTNTAPTNIDATIDIELGKNVNFSGMGLKTDLQGKLQLVKSGEKMSMYGDVNMSKARYKSYGQDLTVRKGQFVFNGPVDNPSLNVEATRLSTDKKVTAILSVTGTPDNLKTRIYAEPSLPETEALAYLIAGKPLNQASKAEGGMIAGAALSYGAGQASWLTEKLGLDEFEVQEGNTLQSTLLAVGQYLTPDFYVGAKVGLFNKQVALVLKHKLTDTLNVETQTGESQRIKLNYEIDTD
jgi:autotransporter translocation and assembly factor TamB